MSAPKLGAAGKKLWTSITGSYELRPDELSTLEDACRVSDMIDRLEKAWAADGRPMTTKGSMGQLVIHPAISELRTHRTTRAALLKQLKLPEESSAPKMDASSAARHAANARWSKGA